MKLQSFAVAFAATRVAALLIPHQEVLDHRIPSSSSIDNDNAKSHGLIVKPVTTATRKLTGRFLHITDIHPDPYYKTYASTDEDGACHRGKGVSGYYGAETSDCDSPLTLVNATFDWIKANLRDDIDFIVWTGDSARHDNDEDVPRSRVQVIEQNQLIETKFREVFGRDDDDDEDPTNDYIVPIIPTFGNNDILPHNIFEKGPNSWTTRYLTLWRSMIPEEQRHNFARGGWFSVEVIPNQLTVFTLNTLYFFTSNGAVDGCAIKKQPGHEQFEWLRIQLDIIRSRGMKAILIGHVAPARVDAKVSWDETCWQKYTLWMHQYRDIVISGIYGHMNIDHFMIQDFSAVKKHVLKGYEYANEEALTESIPIQNEQNFSTTSVQDYLESLRSAFAKIPSVKANTELDDDSEILKKPKKGKKKHGVDEIGGEFAERYSLTFVSPSVIPNYFPSLRVFSYNITGLESIEVPRHSKRVSSPLPVSDTQGSTQIYEEDVENESEDSHLELRSVSSSNDDLSTEKKKKKKKKAPRRFKFHVPSGPSKTTPPGPGYSPQSLSLLGYKQYAANLTLINNDFTHDDDDDDKSATSQVIRSNASLISNGEDSWDFISGQPLPQRWKPGKHHNKKPKHPKPKPLPFKYELEYDTMAPDDAFGLADLSTREILNLAARIAGTSTKDVSDAKPKKKDRVWVTFLTRAFVGAIDPEDIEGMYGH
jgi:endopolyphosphatase